MITIVTLLGSQDAAPVWEKVIEHKEALQSAIKDSGRLLYLTKRVGYNEASLFLHLKEQDVVVDLVTKPLANIDAVSRLWVVPLFRPRFFPLPRDTHAAHRFVLTLKVAPAHLMDVYKRLLNPVMPDGLRKVYYAFTLQLYDNVIQFSLLTDKAETLRHYVETEINNIKGVLKTNLYEIEKTKPFITYDDWQVYAGEKAPQSRWKNMFTHIDPVRDEPR